MNARGDTPEHRLQALLLLLCFALGLVVAGNSALAIALPDLAADLGANQRELTWIIDVYALTFAALLLPAGIAADRLGRRSVLAVGLVVFGVAGVASAFAPGVSGLIALRAVAGVGAAAVFPVTLSALVDAYPEQQRGFAVAVWSGVSAAGAVLGTLIAGGLLELFWWGSVQLAFGLGALLLLPGVAVLVAENRNPRLALDPVGALWSVLALATLVYGIIEAPDRGWTAPLTLAAFGVAALAVVAFVRHELAMAEPSLDVRAFRSPALTAGSCLVALQFFASLALFVLAPQYLQIVRDHTPLQAAAALLVIPLGVGAGTGLAPAALARFGARWPGAGGLLAMAAGFAALAVALKSVDAGSLPLWALAPGLIVFGFGFGLAITPGTVLILDGLPPERRSVASAVNDLTREVGGVLGIAVLSSALISGYRDDIADDLAALPPELAGPAGEGAGTALAVAGRLGTEGPVLVEAARTAFTAGLATSLWIGAAVLTAAAVLCLVLVPRRAAAGTDARDGGPAPVQVGSGIGR